MRISILIVIASLGLAACSEPVALIVIASLGLAACSEPVARNTGAYMLLDTSGTYRTELVKAENIITYTLSQLEPADSFAVARIDTASFSEKDIVAKVTFNDRPSTANSQKRQFSERIGRFVDGVGPAPHTDITGGLLQAIEFLNEKQTGRKIIFIFSDLEEDLMDGGRVRARYTARTGRLRGCRPERYEAPGR
jgi:hypothetical protein